jgi:hypothetical protein
LVVDKKTRKVISTAFANGKRHDFRLFTESKTHILKEIQVDTDTGYQGIKRLHANSLLPKKEDEEKAANRRGKGAKPQNIKRASIQRTCYRIYQAFQNRIRTLPKPKKTLWPEIQFDYWYLQF